MKPFMLRKKKKLVAVARRKILSARMGDTRDYRMTTIDSVLRRSLDDRSGELILTLDPHFQGLPDTAHGGSVLAAFDALAGLTGPRHVGGVDQGRRRTPAHQLPISRTCFACGVDNTLGLRVRLEFDDAEVSGAWTPREPFRTADGTLTTVALTTLCDEAAFWLGALATGESGMTTELAVTLRRAVPFGGTLTVAGARADARPRPDPRYWNTEVLVRTEDRTLVASARITFVVVRGAARRLVQGLLAINDPAIVARVFPAYAR